MLFKEKLSFLFKIYIPKLYNRAGNPPVQILDGCKMHAPLKWHVFYSLITKNIYVTTQAAPMTI